VKIGFGEIRVPGKDKVLSVGRGLMAVSLISTEPLLRSKELAGVQAIAPPPNVPSASLPSTETRKPLPADPWARTNSLYVPGSRTVIFATASSFAPRFKMLLLKSHPPVLPAPPPILSPAGIW
jgi:hypothetical protein